MVRPYSPPALRLNGGAFYLLAMAGVGGAFLGIAGFLFSLLYYLVVALPIGIGLIAGAIIVGNAKRWQVAQPRLLVLSAVLCVLTAFGVFHEAENVRFRTEFGDLLAEEMGTSDFYATRQAMDDYLAATTGSTGFWGYHKLVAQEGVSVGRLTGVIRIPLRGWLVWGYWALELLLMLGVALVVVVPQSAIPFCERCRTWFDSEQVGRVPGVAAARFAQLAQEGQYRAAGELLDLGAPPAPYLAIFVRRCSCERGDSILMVNQVTTSRLPPAERIRPLRLWLTPAQENDLLEATSEWEEGAGRASAAAAMHGGHHAAVGPLAFTLTAAQMARYEAWAADLERRVGDRQLHTNPGLAARGREAHGAGERGAYSFTFCPTAAGLVVQVHHTLTGETLELTDYHDN